jgi:hypothetical protein
MAPIKAADALRGYALKGGGNAEEGCAVNYRHHHGVRIDGER